LAQAVARSAVSGFCVEIDKQVIAGYMGSKTEILAWLE
jgi:hypothetical protein